MKIDIRTIAGLFMLPISILVSVCLLDLRGSVNEYILFPTAVFCVILGFIGLSNLFYILDTKNLEED